MAPSVTIDVRSFFVNICGSDRSEEVPSYSPEFKEQTVRKLMPPHNRTVASLSQEIGVSEATLYNWKKQFRAKGYVVPKKSTIADQWDAKAKLAAVIQTAAMNEAERSEYCRKHGLYPEQIDAWKAAFEASEPGQAAPSSKSDLAAERKKSAGRSGGAADLIKKSPGHLGHERGRLIPLEMKQMAMVLINEAVQAGARQSKACAVLGLTCRTLRRWRAAESLIDRRKGALRRPCYHALGVAEKEEILATCNRPEYQSLPPSQIVPRLADKGLYLASESTFYRVLREHGQANRRGRAQPPRTVPKPHAWLASAPLKTWSWDITFLPTAVRGQFYRLYMVMDVYSRMIVGWEIHEDERAEHAAMLITKACLRHRVRQDALVLHADNGSPMKGATMLATLQRLGIVPSFSRPAVSDDNAYSEALFRTLKYSPAYPKKP